MRREQRTDRVWRIRLLRRFYHAVGTESHPNQDGERHLLRDGLPAATQAHDVGTPAQVRVVPPERSLLLIQGPLMMNWHRRKWGILPRLENADLHGGSPPTMTRFDLWLRAGVGVVGRPQWMFVKLHTHGRPSAMQRCCSGAPMRAFHQSLADYAACHPQLRYYYVTARDGRPGASSGARSKGTGVLMSPKMAANALPANETCEIVDCPEG